MAMSAHSFANSQGITLWWARNRDHIQSCMIYAHDACANRTRYTRYQHGITNHFRVPRSCTHVLPCVFRTGGVSNIEVAWQR